MPWSYNPDRYDCSWCACRRFRSMAALDAHIQEHKEAERRARENGVALKDSRAMAERLAATVPDWAPETKHARDCAYVTSDGPAPCTCPAGAFTKPAAATAEIEAARERGERLARVLP